MGIVALGVAVCSTGLLLSNGSGAGPMSEVLASFSEDHGAGRYTRNGGTPASIALYGGAVLE